MAEFFRCKDCKHDKGKCVGSSRRGWHKYCFEPKVMTNADHIRAMSDEELCEFLMCDVICDQKISPECEDCEKCVMDWLQQPVKEV